MPGSLLDLSLDHAFSDCIVQGIDVLALNGLDDDDTTQASSTTIKEDLSFVFYSCEDDDDEEEHSDEDSQERPPFSVVMQAYETTKSLWSTGKTTRTVGTLLNMTEGAVFTVAQKVGIPENLETEMVKPQLQAVDRSLNPAYSAFANAWNGLFPTPTTNKSLPRVISFSRPFEDENDEDNWIPIDPPKTTMPDTVSFQEKQQQNYQQREATISSL